MDTAIDTGCLRYMFNTGFTSIVISSTDHRVDRDGETAQAPINLCPNSLYLFGRLTNQCRMTCSFSSSIGGFSGQYGYDCSER